MRVSLWSLLLVLSAVACIAESDSSSLRQQVDHPQIRLLQDDRAGGSARRVLDEDEETDAPSSVSSLATEAPTATSAPTKTPTEENTLTEAPSGDGTIEEAPTDDTGVLVPVGSPVPSTGSSSEVVTPAPSHAKTPTYPTPTYPAPTYKAPTYDHSPPTQPSYAFPASAIEPPTEEYVPPDDDPIKNEGTEEEVEEWADNITLEQMEKDRNVLIALSTVAGVGFLLMIMTAHQMLENPDGCCARYVSASWKESSQSKSRPTFLLTFILCIA
jgi:hypothetical protein